MKNAVDKLIDLFHTNHLLKLCTKAVLIMLACCMSVQMVSADPESTASSETTQETQENEETEESETTEKTEDSESTEEAEGKIYISDVMIGYSDVSADEAKRELTSEGYTVVDENLNEGTVKSSDSTQSYTKGYAYMGYKTTENKDEAITDISMMNMNGGYTLVDYIDILKKQNSAYLSMAAELKNACEEFRANLKKESPAAVRALKALNTMYVSEQIREPLGDWLLDESRDEADYVQAVYRQTTAQTLSLIYNEIMLGVYDYKNTPTNAVLSGSEDLKVSAALTGRDWSDESYTFVLTAQDSSDPMPESNTITLTKDLTSSSFGDIQFEKEGTFVYTITQQSSQDDPYTTYDESTYTVTVTVTCDASTNSYVAESVMKKDGTEVKDHTASFTNVNTKYELDGSVYLQVETELTGRQWYTTDAFTYTLTAVDDAPMPENTVDSVSSLTTYTSLSHFENIIYTSAGTYSYTIRQTIPEEKGDITYDTAVYDLTVHVIVNTDGTYSFSTSLKDENGASAELASFTNIYTEPVPENTLSGSEYLQVEAEFIGRSWNYDDAFTFEITAENARDTDENEIMDIPLPESSTLTITQPSGTDTVSAHFGNITYTAAGTYYYTIRQLIPEEEGDIAYDTVSYTIRVHVSENQDGTFSVSAGSGKYAFVNEYKQEGTVNVSGNQYLHVSTSLTGRDWEDTDSFAFTISADSYNAPLPSDTMIYLTKDRQDAGFGYLTFTEEGTYSYTIQEVKGEDENITYDTDTYQVIVDVTKTGEELYASVTMQKDSSVVNEASFINTYTKPASSDTEEELPAETADPSAETQTEESTEEETETNKAVTIGDSWAGRMSKTGPIDYSSLNDPDLTTHKDQARGLITSVKTFYENYTKAKQAVDANNGVLNVSDISTASQAQQVSEDVLSGTDENAKGLTEAQNAVAYIAYISLKQYSYGVTNIADYLISIGRRLADGEEEANVVEDLYPMAYALTDGQYAVIRVVGIEQYVLCMNNTEEAFAQADADFTAAYQAMIDANNGNAVYAFDSVDTEKWENKVGYTDEARRRISAGEIYEQYQKENEDSKVTKLDLAKNYVMFIMEISSAAYGIVMLAAMGTFSYMTGTLVSVSAASAMMMANVTASVGGFLQASLAGGPLAVTIACVVALVVIGIIYLVDWIMDQYDYYHPTYTDIPLYMYDKPSDTSGILEYKAIRNREGKAVDINIWHGLEWNALYYTKDTEAGSPIVLDKDGNFLIIQQNDSTTPEYYSPLTKFGESLAANLNENIYDSDKAPSLYVFFQRSDQYDDQQAGIKAEEERKGTYLESIIVGSASSEKAARSIINKAEGYQIVNFDLTWNDTSTFTYIGYKTTKSYSGAIKDIRVGINTNSAQAFVYGGSSYGLAGSVNGMGIYYTKSETAGDPIVANIIASKKAIDTEEGTYEPVNLFSGGNAVDLLSNFHISSSKEQHSYLYFENSVQYNKENSKEYLGGFSFVGLCSESLESSGGLGNTGLDTASLLKSANSLAGDYGLISTGDTAYAGGYYAADDTNNAINTQYLYYSITYNPKRAIYDVKTYEAENAASSVSANISTGSVGYGACATYLVFNTVNSTFAQHARFRPDNAFQGGEYYYSTYTDFSDTDLMYYYEMKGAYKGLYVSGPASGYEPLTAEDFVLTYTKEDSSEKLKDSTWTPVCDFTDTYCETPTNFGIVKGKLNTDYTRENVITTINMFLKTEGRPHQTKKKYIKSIQVVYSDTKNYSEDSVTQQLLASGGDEIIKFNLSSKTGESYMDYAGYGDGDVDLTRTSEEAIEAFNSSSYKRSMKISTVNGGYTNQCAYLRITRTDNANEAITDVLIYDISKNGSELASGVSTQIKRNKVTYTLCDGANNTYSKITSSAYSSFYLYATTSYAARDGVPITNISFSTSPLENGCYTVKEDQGSGFDAKVYDRSWYMHLETANTTQYDYDSSGSTTINGVKKTANLRYVDAVETIIASSEKEAAIELVNRDCTFMIDGDLYGGGSDEQCYIGYHKGTSSKKAYKNIILMPLTVADSVELKSGVMQIKITYNGVPYSLICDTCLNGKFLFATKDTGAGPAITNLMVGDSLADAKSNALTNDSLKLESNAMMEKIYWRAMESEYNQQLSDANFAAGFSSQSATRYVYLGTEEQYVKSTVQATMVGSVFSQPSEAMLMGLSSIFVSIAVIYYVLHRKRKM